MLHNITALIPNRANVNGGPEHAAILAAVANFRIAVGEEYAQLQAQIAEADAKLMAWHKADECSRRLPASVRSARLCC
jgi:transposase